MSIDSIHGLPKPPGLGSIPGPHQQGWKNGHGGPHEGAGPGGFPPMGGHQRPGDVGRALPGGGQGENKTAPGPDRPGHGHTPGGPGNPGVDRPGHGNPGPQGVEPPRPQLPSLPGMDRPGHQPPVPHGSEGPGHHGVDRPGHHLPGQQGVDRPGHVPPGHQGGDRPGMSLPNLPGVVPGHAGHGPAAAGSPALFHGQGPGPVAHATVPPPMAAVGAHATPATPAAHAGAHAAQTSTVPPQQAPMQAVPTARADAASQPPPGAQTAQSSTTPALAGERMAMLQRPAGAPMALPANHAAAPAAPAAAGAAVASAAAATVASAVANQPALVPAQVAATQAANQAATAGQTADARVAPLTGGDRGQVMVRPDIAGTYTGEGPQRRRMDRALRALPGGLSTLLLAMGGSSAQGAVRDPAAAERELRAAIMQWLFWLLAVIAYGCVAFAVIGLLPPGTFGGGSGGGAVGGRAWTGGFAIAGLVAGVGAWWFARGISRDAGVSARRDRRG